MIDKLFFTINAIFPIILVVIIGYFLKSIRLLPRDFFSLLNKLSFRCCLPVLLFYNVYGVNNIDQVGQYTKVIIFALVSILVFFGIGLITALLCIKDPKQKGVIIQVSYRSNYAVIGIPLAMSLSNNSSEPVAVASILSSVCIPLFNVLATIALSLFTDTDEKHSFISSAVKVIKKIVTNPLIIGVVSGFVVLTIRHFIPVSSSGSPVFTIKNNLPFLYSTIQMLAQAAGAVALLALGGNFEFSAIARLRSQIILGTLLRIVICPAVCLTAAYMFGFREIEFPALISLYGTPIAISSVPMAQEMNNDYELAGQLVVWTSFCSTITLFAIIFICTQVGIFVL